MKRKALKQKVVVITGASSGNGRAAALEFAKTGARLVLAARNLRVLEEVVAECEKLGAQAIAVKTDVTQFEQVQSLALAAKTHFGRIDVWINNAGVGAVGELNQTSLESHVHVIQTNLLGAFYGAYAVMPYFKFQKSGILINTNSIGAFIPLPYGTSYSASKFGLRGFLEALRAEVSDEPDIHICEVFPAFLKTPGIHHAANYVGRKIANPPGAGDPRKVARTMVRISEHPKDRAQVMLTTAIGRTAYFLAPKIMRWAMHTLMKQYFKHAEEAPISNGNVIQAGKAHFGVTADKVM